MTFLSGLFYFVLVAGVLIFIHEGGHFLMAKLFKVKVLVFSLGMGPRILGVKKKETDYRLSMVPIGGYVKMLGEDPTEAVADGERAFTVSYKPAWQRALIYAAGPAMNLVFPLFLYFFLALGHTEVPTPEVGQVFEGSPAQEAGLRAGDEILSINDNRVYSFGHMAELITDEAAEPLMVTFLRNGEKRRVTLRPDITEMPRYPQFGMLRHLREKRALIGVHAVYENSIVSLTSGGAAYDAGLREFDHIRRVDDIPVPTLVSLERALQEKRGQRVTLVAHALKPDLDDSFFPDAIEAQTIDPDNRPSVFEKTGRRISIVVPDKGDVLSQLGIRGAAHSLVKVTPDGAAAEAGLRRGDRLLGIDGRQTHIYDILNTLQSVEPGADDTRRHQLLVERDGESFTVPYQARYISAGQKGDLGVDFDRVDPGFYTRPYTREWSGVPPSMHANPNLLGYAGFWALSQTLSAGRMIIDVLGAIVTGNMSPKMFSGPIGIAQAAAQVGEEGPGALFVFMAFISLNLGLLNLLLPIPVLDGGRLVLVLAEVVMRRRLTSATQEKIMIVGAVMTLLLVVWAMIWDVVRLVVT